MTSAANSQYLQAIEDIESNLNFLDPGEAVDDTRWQDRKSANTRYTILESTIECLAEFGYSKTSTQLVTENAEISRGTMLHHYATKADLISAVIDFINFKRLRKFYESVKKLSDVERVEKGVGLELWWRFIKEPEYEAYLELNVAARKDADLKRVFDKKAAAHDAFILRTLPMVFPEWKGKPAEDLQLAHDFTVASLSGLLLNSNVIKSRKRRQGVRTLIYETISRLRDSEI